MAKRILAIHSGALGDVILFSHFLSALRGESEKLALAARSDLAILLSDLGVVDEPISFAELPMHELFTPKGPAADGALARRLGRCDTLISCFGFGDELARQRLTKLTDAKNSIFLPIRPPADQPIHLLDFWANQAGLDELERRRLSEPPRWQVNDRLRQLGQKALEEAGISRRDNFAGAPHRQRLGEEMLAAGEV